MAIDLTKFIVFSDVYALQNEGFTQKPGHGYDITSDKLMTKLEVYAMWDLRVSNAEWVELADDRWVARWRMTPRAFVPDVDVPSIPVLTTNYTNPTHYVTHSWTNTTFTTSWQMIITTSFGLNDYQTLSVTNNSGRAILQHIPRDCSTYQFRIRAYNGNDDVYGGWSNITTANLQLTHNYFTDEFTDGDTLNTEYWPREDKIVAGKMTNDGYNVYYIEDNDQVTGNIVAFGCNTAYDISSINLAYSTDSFNISTLYSCSSGFVSDDAAHAYLAAKSRTINYATNPNGWTPVGQQDQMDFTRVSSFQLAEVVDYIRDMVLSEDYRTMLIADGSTIHQYTCTSAWNNNWTYVNTFNSVGNLPAFFTAGDIQQIQFVNSGFGLIIKRDVRYDDGVNRAIRFLSTMYLELGTAYNLWGSSRIDHTLDSATFGTEEFPQSFYIGQGPYFIFPLKGIYGNPADVCDSFGYIAIYQWLDSNNDPHDRYYITQCTADKYVNATNS